MLKISNLRRLFASSLTILGSVIAGHVGTAHARIAGDDEEFQTYHSATPTRESFFNKKHNDDDLELLEELGLDPVTPSNLDFSETQVELVRQNNKKEDSVILEKDDEKIPPKTAPSSKTIRRDEAITHTSSATVSNALGEEAPTVFGPLSHERNVLDDLSDNVRKKVKSIFTRPNNSEQAEETNTRTSRTARNAKEAEAAASSMLGEEIPSSFGPLSNERNVLDDWFDDVSKKVKSIFTRPNNSEQVEETNTRTSRAARNAKEAEAATSSMLGEEIPSSFGPLSNERNVLDDWFDDVSKKVKSIFTRPNNSEQVEETNTRTSRAARNAKEAEAAASSMLGEEIPSSFGPLSNERNVLDDWFDGVVEKTKSLF